MAFDLIDLRLFVAIAETGSITAGASRAGLALPSASARIRGMEQRLGTGLLLRGRRGVRPTVAGEALAAQAGLVLAQMEQLRGDLRAHAAGAGGRVRLLANTAALAVHLPRALGAWLAAHPGTEIEVREATSEAVAEAIALGKADIGILSDQAETASLRTLHFRRDDLVLLLPAGHRFARHESISFATALAEPMIGLPEEAALSRHLARQAARIGAPLRPRARMPGFAAIAGLVLAGAGLAILPEAAIPAMPGLARVPIAESWARRRLLLCTRAGITLPAHARGLLDHLVQSAEVKDEDAAPHLRGFADLRRTAC